MWHVWGREEVHTVFWWGFVRERDAGVGGRIILRLILSKQDVRS